MRCRYAFRWSPQFVLLIVLLLPAVTLAQTVFSPSYPDSAEGLRSQFAEVTRLARSSDRQAFQTELNSLGIPNSEKWFAAHFDPRFQSQLSQYATALSAYQSHISWVMVNFAKFDDFEVGVQTSETPDALRDTGMEALLPRPLDAVKIENYRLSSTSPNPKHGPPSWVSSFVYIEGRFRYVGGTYPFWAEHLNSLRGPMSIPPAVIHGRTVQGVAFQEFQKGQGVDAVIKANINVGRDGHVNQIQILSGDAAFVKDAKEYLKAADFGPLPDIPQVPNATRNWEMVIVFFAPKS